MNKIIFTFFATIISLGILAQTETIIVESDKVVIPAGKKLGIGESNPSTALDVTGGIKIGSTLVTEPGVLKYESSQFQGWSGSSWINLGGDVSNTNELQTISKFGNVVTLSNSGGSFIDQVNDNDNNPSNEKITGITLTNNVLKITEDGTQWSRDLSNISPLERNGTVLRATGNYLTDDFIIGRDELPQPGQNYSDNLFFFDKSKGAFRGGRLQTSQNWVNDSIGFRSFAYGFNSLALGGESIAIGNSKAYGTRSVSMGHNNKSFGSSSVSFGFYALIKSFAETSIGAYNTDYSAENLIGWDEDDRLFVIGNGTSSTRSDALSLWKDGQLGLGESNPTS